MDINFTPLVDFHDDDLRSDYCVGLSYRIRPGNERLAAKVEQWLAEKKVRLGVADNQPAATAKVRGAGTVK